MIAIGVYGKVRSLYFLGITPSLNLMVAILISDAFVQHMMKLDQGMEIESETNDSKVKCKYGNNSVLCDASKHCSE